jgi:hypothetical protein
MVLCVRTEPACARSAFSQVKVSRNRTMKTRQRNSRMMTGCDSHRHRRLVLFRTPSTASHPSRGLRRHREWVGLLLTHAAIAVAVVNTRNACGYRGHDSLSRP